METETIDKLYLELSQVTSAKTAREIELESSIGKLTKERDEALALLRSMRENHEHIADRADEVDALLERDG